MSETMDRPRRIQRRRTRGWEMPPNTVPVGRGTRFGNPFVCDDPSLAVSAFRAWLNRERVVLPEGVSCAGGCHVVDREAMLRALPTLRGRDLACWCPVDQPCHADVLLEMANA